MLHFQASPLIHGQASGQLLYSRVPLSFWGGTDPSTGEVIDRRHPLSGKSLKQHVLAIPSGRGSCTGSVAMLELLLAGSAPLGLIVETAEQILTLGVIVAKKLLKRQIPVVRLPSADFTALRECQTVTINGADVYAGAQACTLPPCFSSSPLASSSVEKTQLSRNDRDILAKGPGNAKGLAMEILLEFATLQGSTTLVSVSQAHIDACIYTGPASTLFAEYFLGLEEARVAVPTTMNSISIDQRRWAEIGTEPVQARAANKLANAYVAMGARPTFTCAPYLLDSAPQSGEHVGWAESNAVVFANSVLAARTQKYPDFIDVCIALTGRAPYGGCHLPQNRVPQHAIQVPEFDNHDESLFPLLGYLTGVLSGHDIPIVIGMEHIDPSVPDLKAFGAAFATTSSAPMFHIRGVTPEAMAVDVTYEDLKNTKLHVHDLRRCWQDLNTTEDESVSLVALGNPHFSAEEFNRLVTLCEERAQTVVIPLVITTSRGIHEELIRNGQVQILQHVGAQVISDTCWCMLTEPVDAIESGNIMTNSAKYAHYAPGLVKRRVHFGSLKECVEAAFSGYHSTHVPAWLHSAA